MSSNKCEASMTMREFFARAARVIYLLRLKLEDAEADTSIPLPYDRMPVREVSRRL